jgi:hypothetical protein
MIRSLDALWIAVLLLAGTGVCARAAFTFPPELEKMSDEEKARYLRTEGERSLREKLQVGRERYQERQAFRREVVNAMWTNYEARRAAILSQVAPAPPSASASREPAATGSDWQLWLAGLGIVGLCTYHYIRRWQAEA